jgi:nitrogen regulatory protein P-II 1
MKRIVAVFKPVMLDAVVFALHRIENFPGGTVSDVQTIGPGGSRPANGADEEAPIGYPMGIRLEIVCGEDLVESVLKAILDNARTGRVDDGLVSVSAVERMVPITARS